MTSRRHRPNRRPAETFEIEVGGLRYACTVGRYPDDSLGEIFLSANKNGSAADVSARDSAIAISLNRHLMRRESYAPRKINLRPNDINGG
jgi:hypothetical protein